MISAERAKKFLKNAPLHAGLMNWTGGMDYVVSRRTSPPIYQGIQGWGFFARGQVRAVEIYDGARKVGELVYGWVRADIAQNYPDFPQALHSGFSGMVFLDKASGKHFSVMAVDQNGQRHEIFRLKVDSGVPRQELSLAPESAGRSVLVIDDQIPKPHGGRGYGRMYALLGQLRELGMRVDFFSVLGAGKDIQKFLGKRTHSFDTVIISREHNFMATAGWVKKFMPKAFLIYDAESLSFNLKISRLRSYGTSDPVLEGRLAKAELDLIRMADVTICVSDRERSLILSRRLGETVTPVYRWSMPCLPAPTSKSFKQRRDILFIGTFTDTGSPNEDAILYFMKEIFPLVRAKVGCALDVVGANPPKALKNLGLKGVRVPGFVKDLTPYYENSLIFIVPHRYSAGISLKLLEAMSRGVPAVVSGRIAEELGLKDGKEALVADTPASFADKINRLYHDEILWDQLRANGLEYIRAHYDPIRLKETLGEILAPGKRAF